MIIISDKKIKHFCKKGIFNTAINCIIYAFILLNLGVKAITVNIVIKIYTLDMQQLFATWIVIV